MANQLYYSQLHSKSICLGMYYEVHICYNSIKGRARMQVAVLCDEATNSSTLFAFLKGKGRY